MQQSRAVARRCWLLPTKATYLLLSIFSNLHTFINMYTMQHIWDARTLPLLKGSESFNGHGMELDRTGDNDAIEIAD